MLEIVDLILLYLELIAVEHVTRLVLNLLDGAEAEVVDEAVALGQAGLFVEYHGDVGHPPKALEIVLQLSIANGPGQVSHVQAMQQIASHSGGCHCESQPREKLTPSIHTLRKRRAMCLRQIYICDQISQHSPPKLDKR